MVKSINDFFSSLTCETTIKVFLGLFCHLNINSQNLLLVIASKLAVGSSNIRVDDFDNNPRNNNTLLFCPVDNVSIEVLSKIGLDNKFRQ